MSKAKDVFDKLLDMALVFEPRRYPKPGALLERLSEKDRKELTKLESGELNDRVKDIL